MCCREGLWEKEESASPQEKIFLSEVKKQKIDPELHSVPETI